MEAPSGAGAGTAGPADTPSSSGRPAPRCESRAPCGRCRTCARRWRNKWNFLGSQAGDAERVRRLLGDTQKAGPSTTVSLSALGAFYPQRALQNAAHIALMIGAGALARLAAMVEHEADWPAIVLTLLWHGNQPGYRAEIVRSSRVEVKLVGLALYTEPSDPILTRYMRLDDYCEPEEIPPIVNDLLSAGVKVDPLEHPHWSVRGIVYARFEESHRVVLCEYLRDPGFAAATADPGRARTVHPQLARVLGEALARHRRWTPLRAAWLRAWARAARPAPR